MSEAGLYICYSSTGSFRPVNISRSAVSFFSAHNAKGRVGVEIQFHSFLCSALGGGLSTGP
jgi:hypothetical protein